tara:strand:- start:326 stop:577 length:252 start_codon:yes stop_codon:yes gene_type:complete
VGDKYKIGSLVKVVPFWNANGTEKIVSDVGIIVSNTETLCDHPFFDILEYEMECDNCCYKVSVRGKIFLFTDLELELINAPEK